MPLFSLFRGASSGAVALVPCLLLAFSVSLCAQTTVSFPPARPALEVTYPAGWEVKEGKKVEAQPESGMLWLTLEEVTAAPSLEAVAKDAAMQAGDVVNHLKVGGREVLKLEGKPFLLVSGTGKMKGSATPMLVKACYFQNPDKSRAFLFLYYGTRASVDQNFAALQGMLSSITFN